MTYQQLQRNLKHRRLHYKSRPAIYKVCQDLRDDKLAQAMMNCYNVFHVDALMNSYAFELLRLKFTDYLIIFSHQYYDYVFEIRETCPHEKASLY